MPLEKILQQLAGLRQVIDGLHETALTILNSQPVQAPFAPYGCPEFLDYNTDICADNVHVLDVTALEVCAEKRGLPLGRVLQDALRAYIPAEYYFRQ